MSNETLRDSSRQMDRNLEAIALEFGGVRTGKASPAILDTVNVDAYGASVPMKQVANVSAPESQMLLVQPYDPQLGPSIAKAIQSSDLGLNPSVDGNIVRVSIPALTEERRKDLVKVLHRMTEEGRVAVRHARHKAKSDLEKSEREGDLGEDDLHRLLDDLQRLTDSHITKLDEMLKAKEAEVMEV